MYSAAGVGKTAFLRQTADVWECSRFVQTVIRIDLDPISISTLEDVLLLIWDKLVRQRPTDNTEICLETPDPENLDFRQWTLQKLHGTDFVLILDSLQASFPPPFTLWTESEHMKLLGFLKDLFSTGANSSNKRGHYLIYAHRLDSERWWKTHFESTFESTGFLELKGVHIEDALEISERLLGEADKTLSASRWTNQNLYDLECCLRILQCNPLALKSVFSRTEFDINNSFKNMVLWEAPKLRKDASARSFLDELDAFFDRNSERLPPLSSLCHFWHQGLNGPNWENQLKEIATTDELDDLTTVVMEARIRGMVDIDDQEISWVHPLFTLALRRVGFGIPWNRPVPSENSNPASPQTQTEPYFQASIFERVYLGSLEFQMSQAKERHAIVGVDWEDACAKAKRYYLNVFQALHYCSSTVIEVSLEHWPFLLFEQFAPLSQQTLLASERLSFAHAYEAMLETLLDRLGGPGIEKENFQLFVFKIINRLTSVYQWDLRDPEKRSYFSSKFAQIVVATERRYGRTSDEDVLYEISLGWKIRAFFLLQEQEGEKEADEAWANMIETDQRLYDQETTIDNTGIYSNEGISRALQEFATDEFEAQNIRQRLSTRPKDLHSFHAA